MKKAILLLAAILILTNTFAISTACASKSTSQTEESITKGKKTDYKELKKGSKSDAVKELQTALIEKGYLDGKADRIFGNMTRSAVMLAQYQAGMEVTGIADPEFQIYLFSDECEPCIEWSGLDFELSNTEPDSCLDQNVCFNGRVLQSIVSEDEVVLRLASRGAYEDVVYVTVAVDDYTSELRAGNRVRVYGKLSGLFTYMNKSGNEITLPHISAGIILPS